MLVQEHIEPEKLVAAVAVPCGLVGVGGHVPVCRRHGAEHDVLDRPLHLQDMRRPTDRVCMCARACMPRALNRPGVRHKETYSTSSHKRE